MMEGIEQLMQQQDDAPVARRKQVSLMHKTTTGSKGKGGGRKKKPKFIMTDWEMVLQSNSGMVTQTSSAGNIITMMGVIKKMNGGNADDDFNDFTIGAGGGITSSVITCMPVSLGAGKGQYQGVPTGKRATNNEEMFKAPSRDGSACMVCKYEERGRGARVSACLTHGIRACLVAQPNRQSVKPLMKQGTKHPVTDWSWICPGDMMTCWDKTHLWYRPRKLWSKPAQQGNRVNHVFYAANIRTTLDLYKKKMGAIGQSQSKRDGRSSNKRQILERKRRLHWMTSESVASNNSVQYRIHNMQN
jgi:hypothetical protein